jgi:hypothetical protein
MVLLCRGNWSVVACLMAGSCRLELVDVAVGMNLGLKTETDEERQTKQESVSVGSSYDVAAVAAVLTSKAYLTRSMMA